MGMRKALTGADYLRAVKRLNTLSIRKIAVFLKIGKSSVDRFVNDPENKPFVDEAKEYIRNLEGTKLTISKMTWDTFEASPLIMKWTETMVNRMVSPKVQRAWKRGLFKLCVHLHVTPSDLTIEAASEVNKEQRQRYYHIPQLPPMKGVSNYATLRESIRGFFMSVHNMSGLYLTNLGVGKEELLNQGKYAHIKASQPVRHKMEDILVCQYKETGNIEFFDAFGSTIFMFSTATRETATFEFSFRKHWFELTPRVWKFEIFDKGQRSKKIRWVKRFTGKLLKKFKEWCSERHGIPFDELEDRLPKETDHLFPSFIRNGVVNDEVPRDIIRSALLNAGIPYEKGDFPPLHIWRHTFAQEGLPASGYNYELICSLGGWKNSYILKKHYGKIGDEELNKELDRMQGIEIPDEKKELEW